MKRKIVKPTGVKGSIRLSNEGADSSYAFERIEFPSAKEEVEEFITKGFLDSSKKYGFYNDLVGWHLNETDDFDITIDTSTGRKYLELMEVVNLQGVKGGIDNAPKSYKPYDMAKYICEKIIKKANRYHLSTKCEISLLTYVTDWKFALSESTIAILQCFLAEEDLIFSGVYFYTPMSVGYGPVYLLYPTPIDYWKSFNPEDYKEVTVRLVQPTVLSGPANNAG